MEENKEEAGCVGLIFSFLIPLVGVICYFLNKKTVTNAKAYLYAALGGIAFTIVFQIIAGAAAR